MKIIDVFDDLFPLLDKEGHQSVVDYILAETKNNFVVVVVIDECPTCDEITEFLTTALYDNTNLKIITGGFDPAYYLNLKNTKGINIEVWPYYFLLQSCFTDVDKTRDIVAPITSLFTFMNYRPKLHRKILLDKLAENNLLENNYYTWWNPPMRDGRGEVILNNFSNSNAFITKEQHYNYQHWRPKVVKFLSQADETENPPLFSHPLEVKQSFLNLVAETNVDTPFVTEKTYNTILWKKPFIILGYPGTHRYLQDIGFKLPAVIDYSFDTEPDSSKRTDLIVNELLRLSKIPLNELNQLVKETVDHNYNHLFNMIRKIETPVYLQKYVDKMFEYPYTVNKSTER